MMNADVVVQSIARFRILIRLAVDNIRHRAIEHRNDRHADELMIETSQKPVVHVAAVVGVRPAVPVLNLALAGVEIDEVVHDQIDRFPGPGGKDRKGFECPPGSGFGKWTEASGVCPDAPQYGFSRCSTAMRGVCTVAQLGGSDESALGRQRLQRRPGIRRGLWLHRHRREVGFSMDGNSAGDGQCCHDNRLSGVH